MFIFFFDFWDSAEVLLREQEWIDLSVILENFDQIQTWWVHWKYIWMPQTFLLQEQNFHWILEIETAYRQDHVKWYCSKSWHDQDCKQVTAFAVIWERPTTTAGFSLRIFCGHTAWYYRSCVSQAFQATPSLCQMRKILRKHQKKLIYSFAVNSIDSDFWWFLSPILWPYRNTLSHIFAHNWPFLLKLIYFLECCALKHRNK